VARQPRTGPATLQGKDVALAALQLRREQPPMRIDNSALPAGSPMYYYCITCGHLAGLLAEDHIRAPPTLCEECLALKECGWLT